MNENNWVEKSKALVWAKFIDENKFSVGEFKLLDTYLSRINARDPSSGKVRFTRTEYCELMGLDPSMRKEQLSRYLQHFVGNTISINRGGKWGAYSLFVSAEVGPDPETGQVVIEIECNYKIKDIFFNLAEDGYARYKLKNIIALDGKYAVRLYCMLKDKPFGFTVKLDELKEYLNVKTKSNRYDQFKFFGAEVLKKALAEINEKTDITADFEKVTEGRKVVAIKFSVKNKAKALPPVAEERPAEEDVPAEVDEQQALYASVLPSELSSEEIKLLADLALEKVGIFSGDVWDVRMQVAEYLRSKTLLMHAQKKKVHPNAYRSWLAGAIINDYK